MVSFKKTPTAIADPCHCSIGLIFSSNTTSSGDGSVLCPTRLVGSFTNRTWLKLEFSMLRKDPVLASSTLIPSDPSTATKLSSPKHPLYTRSCPILTFLLYLTTTPPTISRTSMFLGNDGQVKLIPLSVIYTGNPSTSDITKFCREPQYA